MWPGEDDHEASKLAGNYLEVADLLRVGAAPGAVQVVNDEAPEPFHFARRYPEVKRPEPRLGLDEKWPGAEALRPRA